MAARETLSSSGNHRSHSSMWSVPDDWQLARAGFFYNPTSSSPDNTTCYLCQNSLDGWEKDDDAVVEHLKHAPDCGWAITVAIELDIENGSYSLEDPMSEKILNARRMTFGSNWPHENKRGWICKTQKVSLECLIRPGFLLMVNKDDRGWVALLSDSRKRGFREVFVL